MSQVFCFKDGRKNYGKFDPVDMTIKIAKNIPINPAVN